MDGVAISIIGRPRPLPGHDTPNPAYNTYTLKCEEPVWMSLVLLLLASVLSLSGRYWSAAWPSLMIGVGGVAIRAWHVTRSHACWLTSLVGGVPPRWKCDCVVIGARNALTHGVRTWAGQLSPGRASREAQCGERWKPWCVNTRAWPVSPKAWQWLGTPPTKLCWPKAYAF